MNFAHLPPQLMGLTLEQNGRVTNDPMFAPGDILKVSINVRDPRGLGIESHFQIVRNCRGDIRQSNWSGATEYSVELSAGDISNCTSLVIQLRNNGNSLRDEFHLYLSVRDDRQAPILTSIEELVNGEALLSRDLKVGDTVSLKVNAYDPGGLPLQTVFYLVRGCRNTQVLKAWSNVNEIQYTFTPQDVTRCTSILIGVKNNDGLDFDSVDYGDLKITRSYSLSIFRTN